MYGVVDPRYRHDPKYLVQSKSISDPEERKRYLNKSIPIYDYFSSICAPEVGMKSGRPHFHALVFMRDFTGSDPNVANYSYRMCTHKIKCLGGECKQFFVHKQIKELDNLWTHGHAVCEAVRFPGDPYTVRKCWKPTPDSIDPKRSAYTVGGYIGKYVCKAHQVLSAGQLRDFPFRTKTTEGFGVRVLLDSLNRLSDGSLYYLSHAKTLLLKGIHDLSGIYNYADRSVAPSIIRRLIRRILAKRFLSRPRGISSFFDLCSVSVPRLTPVDRFRFIIADCIPAVNPVQLPPSRDPERTRAAVIEFFSYLNPKVSYEISI